MTSKTLAKFIFVAVWLASHTAVAPFKKKELDLALDGFLAEIKPFLRMYHCPFDELCDTDMAAAEKHAVWGNVQLVLLDPPYNTRRSDSTI